MEVSKSEIYHLKKSSKPFFENEYCIDFAFRTIKLGLIGSA